MSWWNAKYKNAHDEYEITFGSEYKEKAKIVEKVCKWITDKLVQSEDDIAIVRHGRWENCGDKHDRGMDLKCSVCGNRASSFVGGTEDWWDADKPNYCPNCGARMDGDDFCSKGKRR